MAPRSSAPATPRNGWDSSRCAGSTYCTRCPRFLDREGVAVLAEHYQPDDREALAAMYEDVDAHSRTLGVPPKSRADIEAWLDHLTADGWNVLARLDGRVVGHVAVVPADAAEPEFVVFVHQDYQRRGIGTELLKQAIARAAAAGYDALRLTVAAENDAARALFERLGFEVVERLEWECRMRLSCAAPIASQVRRPPADGR